MLSSAGVTLDLPTLKGLAFGLLGVLSLASMSFVVGAMAKSVQMPFHNWLPDATVAPSAVTAFLHAVAIVKAGLYLMARSLQLMPSLATGPASLINLTLSTVGALTLTACSLLAWLQDDVKRLLAYHTAAQIGYMFLGLGIGTAVGLGGGLFHFLNHAIFKGLLFLGAGCLIHATGTRSLSEMGAWHATCPSPP